MADKIEVSPELEKLLRSFTNGMIIEFEDITLAKIFADEVKKRFNLDSRVFDNSEDAERVHANPFRQKAPVVHVDRPWWSHPQSSPEWDNAWAIEPEIIALAETFGGTFVGT